MGLWDKIQDIIKSFLPDIKIQLTEKGNVYYGGTHFHINETDGEPRKKLSSMPENENKIVNATLTKLKDEETSLKYLSDEKLKVRVFTSTIASTAEALNITIKADPIHVHISPYGLFYYGKEFFNAAKGVVQSTKYSPVPYYLYCHSIELLLKSFLLVEGVPKKELKKQKLYGHDLEKILKGAQKLGLSKFVKIRPEQGKEILKANEYYNIPHKGFEYFEVVQAVTGYPELPDLSLLEKVASELVTNLETVCLNAA